MPPRSAPVLPSPQLTALLQSAAEQGLGIMDDVLRETREGLQRSIDQTRDFFERDARARAVTALAQTGPELRARYPRALREAFERELGGSPSTTSFDTGPATIGFQELELMDEGAVQDRISAVRGLQQVLLESEAELAELNGLVCGLLGLDEVRSERNPLRPEVFVDALLGLLGELQGDAATRTRWTQVMMPVLGKHLCALYRNLLGTLRQQRVQPARYAIHRGVAPVRVAGTAPAALSGQTGAGGLESPAAASRVTVQQLHGLMSGSAPNSGELAREVVNMVIANIAGDQRLLPPVRQLVATLEPALMAVARGDVHFFSDRQHPARQLLEEVAQHGFAYDSVDAQGYGEFVAQLRQAFGGLGQGGTPASFAVALEQLRREWAAAARRQSARQQQAVQALQQAEQRNLLAHQIAEHIRAQPDIVLVPDAVVDFACGPWAQVMAQARMEGGSGQSGRPDCVALLEDLFWSVRPDQARKQPVQLVKVIPRLVQGLREGLDRIHYPADQTQDFLDQLFALHEGRRGEHMPVVPARREPAQPWLAPREAQDSGFMDELGARNSATAPADFPATVPGELPSEFPATEPMSLEERQMETAAGALEPEVPAGPLTLDQLRVGDWVELFVTDHWSRLQLAWQNENATLCLFSSAGGANHSMTLRMFDRLVAQGHLRVLAQGPVVERAFEAVAEVAMRNSIYMDIDRNPGT